MTALWPEYRLKLLKFCVDRSTVLGSSSDRSSGECGVITTPRGRRSLLRRQQRGELSALATNSALLKVLLACALATGALWSVTAARADEAPPPTPTTTTPEAPPPDPYSAPAKPPAQSSKPKSAPRPSTKSTPAAPARSYTPPVQSQSTPSSSAPTYTAPTYRAPTYRAPVTRAKTHRAANKAAHKPRKRVVHHRAKPAPVTVTLAPMAHVLAAAKVPLPVTSADGGKDRYLWLAGLAFALLAVAGLSLHLLSVRVFHLRFE